MTTEPWKTVETHLTAELMVTARFLSESGEIQDFQVILHMAVDGIDAWLVRFETHGGRPHKHVRWEDQGELRHKQAKGWPKNRAAILSKAIHDLKENWETYEGRYNAWTKRIGNA